MKRKIIITMKTSRRLTTFCLTGALTLAASGGALASGNDAALQALFAQANYWHEKSHDELAMESLQKVLSVEANNTQALYLMALWSQQGGDMQAAAQWRARLAKAAPDSPGLQDLDNAKKMSQVPQGQLSLARQQARGGNIPGALATWRSMFNGNTPPAGLAAEYYLTMASDKSLYPQAISELRQYVAQHPQENAPRVALGKALTWREETRREGIALLEPMASGNKEADSGLRQALLWLGPQAGDEQYYDTWMQRHPQDSEVQNYFRQRRSGQARGQGYANLNSGNTAAAKQQFEEVLQTNPQDADALAGMGYIAQRSGDYQAASQYLSRAADLGGDASATRRQQAADALFYGQLAQAQQAYKQGNISQALALSAPLAQQSGAQGASAKLFRADVLRHNKDLPQAEQTLRSLLNDDPQNAAARENLYYVLREQNKSAEAQNLISNPQLQASSTPTQLASIRNGYVINEADRLREQGNYAAAYDKLIRAMQSDPQNTDLMFAMARLYQSGKMNKEAGVVYDYLMTRDTPNQDARAGAIDVALSAGNNDRAEQLAGGLRQDNSPDRLLLLARVAEAQGHHQQAMTYLRSARGKLLGMQSTNSSETPTVGGVKWSPKLTNYLSLILTGERRSLTDSLLSYVGLKDAYSGKTWGQVTKNGGTLQLSYDDGDAGFYVGGGGYSYLGQNVASNTSINANAGVYLRPYHDEYRQLQAGLSMSYMDYSKNLSYFTYGQGGYFSPQNYVSVSLPVSLTEKYDNWTMKLGGSVGYQSYSQDKSAYFPTNSEWQQTLETAVSNGFAKEAYYSATSKSGIGYTLRAGADYKVNKQMTLGGQIGYDTFGDYNESTAGLYIRYMLGDH
ncbi:cellulose synthase subunit BcsC-related outer membrane protein [Klebsiella pneumoniae]|uniref:cellulose biosynthesis protein BcsC n=1 Tax=Klebsiella pneumoniae TaxID=573 RepID=UPI0023816F4F|nr:cellulose biosynthesis protein BcsC [Klebsiella pneumoniae]MDE4768087.1 cellulose synthase subunit BcsC-related outer membrane protein [Klebsiella pneumoniae]